MARVIGVDIPNDKRLEISLTYIFGVGRKTAKDVCRDLNLDPGMKARDLTEEQTTTLAKQEPACTDTFYEQATRTITWDRRRSAYKVVSRIRVFEDTQQRCRTDLTFIYRNPDTKVTLAQKAGSSLGYRKLTGRNFNAPVLSWPRAREMRFTSGDASGKGRRNARLVLVSYIRKTASMPADPSGIELLIVRRIPRDPRMAAQTANPLSPQRNALRGSTAWATVS